MHEPTAALPVVSHVGICVADMDAALRCWCDGFGFELAEGYDLDDTMLPGLAEALEVAPPVAVRSQMIALGAVRIELLAFRDRDAGGAPSGRRDQLGLTHISLRVPDVDAAIERAVAHGATLLPATRHTLGIDLVFLADPDGTRVELMQA